MAILIGLGIGLAPSIIWLIFFDLEDHKHAKALRNIIAGFVLGAFTTFAALLCQLLLNNYFIYAGISTRSPIGVTAFAAIEEILKFFAVVLLIRTYHYFDEPLDAMIFMITVALGFAAVENVASVFNTGNLLQTAVLMKSFQTITLRFLGATLLHSLTSALVGFHWAMGLVRRKFVGWHIVAGLGAAILLHSMFNYLILRTGPATWALVFVVSIAFFVLIDFARLKKAEDILPQTNG